MKIWKLVAGILSIIMFFIVSLQSCAAGFVNAVENNGEVSGSAGIFVALGLLVGGIVSICVRKSTGIGGNLSLIIIFGLAAFVGFGNYGNFSDLVVWSSWCVINVILAVVSLITSKNNS